MKRNRVKDACRNAARGSYQENLIDGLESWSGARLRGKARRYAGRYKSSSYSLLDRIREAFPKAHLGYRLLQTRFGDRPRRYCLVLVIPDGSREHLFGYPVR